MCKIRIFNILTKPEKDMGKMLILSTFLIHSKQMRKILILRIFTLPTQRMRNRYWFSVYWHQYVRYRLSVYCQYTDYQYIDISINRYAQYILIISILRIDITQETHLQMLILSASVHWHYPTSSAYQEYPRNTCTRCGSSIANISTVILAPWY